MLSNAAIIAKAIEKFVAQAKGRIFTLGPVVVKTLHRNAEGLVVRVDVQPKWEDLAGTLVECPVLYIRGGDGLVIPPMREGDVCLAMFSMVPLQDLIVDKEHHKPHSDRRHSANDCLVLAGSLLLDSEIGPGVGLPAGYTSEDLVIMQKPGRGIWMKDDNSIIIGNLTATGSNLRAVGVDQDSAVAAISADANTKVYIGKN